MIRLGIAALILGLACIPGETSASGTAQAPPVVVLLASDRPTYRVGTAATFTIAVDNPGASPATITFPSGQQYDIAVFAGETEVWRWSAGRAFPQVIREVQFPPGVSLLGRESWDWRDTGGAAPPPGTYRVVATLTADPPKAGNVVEVSLTPP
jgi:hypothetical protein